MFVQVFQGQVSDPAQVRAHLDTWVAELGPSAEGWLGSTAGVTDDGQLVAVARFESEDAAKMNSDRPEQGEWWEGMAALFTSEPEFHNSTSVDVQTYGDPAQAGFVQVMQGRTSDPERSRELMASDPTDWASFRPDILTSLNLQHDDGRWTMVNYFTSEKEAREGEQKEAPPELQQLMDEVNSINIGEPTFYDLKNPWLDEPG